MRDGCQCSSCLFLEGVPAGEERLENPAKLVEPVTAKKLEACRVQGQGSKWIRPEKRHAIYVRDGYTCVYCGYYDADHVGYKLTLDHLIPCEKGGTNVQENLVCACLSDNSARRNLSKRAWYVYLQARKSYDRAHIEEIQAEIRRRTQRRLDREEGMRRALAAKAHRARIEREEKIARARA